MYSTCSTRTLWAVITWSWYDRRVFVAMILNSRQVYDDTVTWHIDEIFIFAYDNLKSED